MANNHLKDVQNTMDKGEHGPSLCTPRTEVREAESFLVLLPHPLRWCHQLYLSTVNAWQ